MKILIASSCMAESGIIVLSLDKAEVSERRVWASEIFCCMKKSENERPGCQCSR